MLKAFLFVVGLALAVLGGESLYHQLANRTPLVITCADYALTRPTASWLRVRDCEVDYLGAGYRESGGTIEELFFPVRPAGALRAEPAALVAATREPSVLAIAQSGIGGGRQPDPEQFLVMMLKIVTALGAAREIEGMARAGILARLRTGRLLSGLTSPLAPGVVVVDLHAEPSVTGPGIQVAAGLGLIVFGGVLVRRTRRDRQLVPAEAAGTYEGPVAGTFLEQEAVPAVDSTYLKAVHSADFGAVAGTSSRARPVRLRGLLLLNLPPGGSAQDIEHAAPLGTRADAVRRITHAIRGIHFDTRGRGLLRGADYAVIVDIGVDDPVSAAIAGADGAAGAEAIRRLLVETGWRAYAPREGAFSEPEDLEELAAPAGAARW